MKREIFLGGALGPVCSATIIIDKDGMRIVDKNEPAEHESDDMFFRGFIRQCIDMDHWQHSWYVDLDRARIKRSNARKEVREIMRQKIAAREIEIKMLKDGIQVLGRWGGKS